MWLLFRHSLERKMHWQMYENIYKLFVPCLSKKHQDQTSSLRKVKLFVSQKDKIVWLSKVFVCPKGHDICLLKTSGYLSLKRSSCLSLISTRTCCLSLKKVKLFVSKNIKLFVSQQSHVLFVSQKRFSCN